MSGVPVEQFRDALQRRAILQPKPPAGRNWRDGLGWQNWRARMGRPQAIVEAEAHRATVAAIRAEREAREAQRYVKAHVRAAAPLGAATAAALQRSLSRWPQ